MPGPVTWDLREGIELVLPQAFDETVPQNRTGMGPNIAVGKGLTTKSINHNSFL